MADSTTTTTPTAVTVPPLVQEKFPDLAALILKTQSMSDEERNYWFQILPIMTEEQVTRLRTILDDEAKQLQALDQKYQGDLKNLNEKHMSEWDSAAAEKARAEREKAESESEKAEAAEEADILTEINQL